MAAITNLSLILIVFFILFLLLISATLLYVLCYRRRFSLHFAAASAATSSTAGDPELTVGWDPYRTSFSKELILYFLFQKDHPSATDGTLSLPPPTSGAVSGNGPSPEADVVVDLGKDFSFYAARRSPPAPMEAEEEEEETPFSTPCSSPSFMTPSSSPPRFAASDDGGREGKSSS